MGQPPDHFPVLGIHEFAEKQTSDFHLLFNELHGERSIDEPHKHDFFIINLFETGKGVHIIDFVEYPIENRQIHLIFRIRFTSGLLKKKRWVIS